MAEKTCYVFKSKEKNNAKKAQEQGIANSGSISRRKALYHHLWNRLETRINKEIDVAHGEALRDIQNFVNQDRAEEYDRKIPSAFVVTGPNASPQLFDKLKQGFQKTRDTIYISLSPAESSNLRGLVRNLIHKGIQIRENGFDRDESHNTESASKLLNYDLVILQDWCRKNGTQKIVIDLQNSESFDLSILTDLVLILHSWIDRLPIILLFGIATSMNDFQGRLPNAAARCLHGESFDVAKTDELVERIFETAVTGVELHLGPSFSGFILQRARDNIQNDKRFLQAIKYAYMCHFYGNPTSVFLDNDLKFDDVDQETFNAVRNFASFREFAEKSLENGEGESVRNMLQSDVVLFQKISDQVKRLQDGLTWMVGAVRVMNTLRVMLDLKGSHTFSTLYLKALTGTLVSSSFLRELYLAVKGISADQLIGALPTLYDTLMIMPASDTSISPDDFRDIQYDLTELIKALEPSTSPTKKFKSGSTSVIKAATLSHQVIQGNAKPQGSGAYDEIASRFYELLEDYFDKCLVDFKGQFPYDILFYDTKVLHHNSLTPRPRFAIERALSSPHDYLGCSCCGKSSGGVASTQPYAAILYQLYNETGALINVFDLWSAFCGIVNPTHNDEQMTMALFFRSLAMLRYMGMLKPSRRRVDHLGKTMWKGL